MKYQLQGEQGYTIFSVLALLITLYFSRSSVLRGSEGPGWFWDACSSKKIKRLVNGTLANRAVAVNKDKCSFSLPKRILGTYRMPGDPYSFVKTDLKQPNLLACIYDVRRKSKHK